MSDVDRRRFLKDALARFAQTLGTVVVATTAVSAVKSDEPTPTESEKPENIQERAERLAASGKFPVDGGDEAVFTEFLNGGFRNTPLGAFRNAPLGGFRNTPLGAFRNSPVGAFRNTPLSTFANGGWPNGAWGGGFRNGGWPNVAWNNWW